MPATTLAGSDGGSTPGFPILLVVLGLFAITLAGSPALWRRIQR